MEAKELIEEMQAVVDVFQQKLNLLRSTQTGQLYDVDILMTRKESAFYINRTTRQFDRLCAEGKIKKEMVDGAVRFRRSELRRYLGLKMSPVDPSKDICMSEFERIRNKYL